MTAGRKAIPLVKFGGPNRKFRYILAVTREANLVKRRAPEGVEFLDDTSAAGWIEERLWSWRTASSGEGARVGSLVPEGFSAYARVFHPAKVRAKDGDLPVRWSTVAGWNGRTVHPQMQFWRIANLSEPHNRAPTWGSVPEEAWSSSEGFRAIAEALGEFTSTRNRCYCCVWEGFGYFDSRLYGSARVRVPHRDHLLFSGHIDAVISILEQQIPWYQSPNIWWPEDRSWCVATDLYSDSTYIGGTDECIERIVDCPEIEVLPTQIDARIDSRGDTINL